MSPSPEGAAPIRPRPNALRTAELVVFDTTFPAHLAQLGTHRLMILRPLFGRRAVIPRAVALELNTAKTRQYAPATQALVREHGLLRVVQMTEDQVESGNALADVLPVKKGQLWENRGEAHAIVLAESLAAENRSVLVIDDGDGTAAAHGRSVPTLGSVYVLMYAALEGIYQDAEAWDIYAQLVNVTEMGIPRAGWHADDEGEAKFHRHLASWRASRASPRAG